MLDPLSDEYCVRTHALRRMVERCGVPVDEVHDTYERHLAMCRLGRFTRLGVREDGSEVLKLFDRGRYYWLARRRTTGLIVSYLTERQALVNAGRRHVQARR